MTTHITHIEGPDAAGHWSFSCTCGHEATGFETADEVLEAAWVHGPLSALSMIPVGEEE